MNNPQILPERLPEPGEIVLVRSRRWLVEDVNTPNGEPSAIVRLACADDDAQGQELEVFWHSEPDRLIVEDEGWSDLALSRLLDEYRTVREERFASTSRKAQASAGLLVVGLQQRLLSSVEAFARTLKVHRATVDRQHHKAQQAEVQKASEGAAKLFTTAPDADDERAEWTADEAEAGEAADVEAATSAAEAEAPEGRRRRRAVEEGARSCSTGCRPSPSRTGTCRTRRPAT